MLDADAVDLPEWSDGFDDIALDDASDLLFRSPLAFADEPSLLDPQPHHQQPASTRHCDLSRWSWPAAEAPSVPVASFGRKTDVAGKAAARLERKAEQNRRVAICTVRHRSVP